MLAIMWIFRRRNPHRVSRGFRFAQTFSAAALALGPRPAGRPEDDGRDLPGPGHRRLRHEPTTELPLWVIFSAAAAISLGTYSGGFRIMRTLGRRIIHLDPPRGFSAESVGASVLYATAFFWQAPVSTTHIITSAIMGAGATKRLSAVRWGVAQQHRGRLGADLPGRRLSRPRLLDPAGSSSGSLSLPADASGAGSCRRPGTTPFAAERRRPLTRSRRLLNRSAARPASRRRCGQPKRPEM